jgi:hypothetical protein
MRNRFGWRNRVLNEVRRRGAGAGNRPGSGPGGFCVCPSCGERVSHVVGNPCYKESCPKCGTKMRKG